ncbi:MAG: VOC family protein [Anaerolineae bacterium]
MTTHAPDHIVYFVPNLEEAYETFETNWGVRPKFGGQHVGRGSHNALLSLGNGRYLEIIAPDPNQPTPPNARSFGMDSLSAPRLVTWAVGTTDIHSAVEQAKAAGYDPGAILPSSRMRSDGVLMEWALTRSAEAAAGTTPKGDWLIPFFIDWGQTPHPSGNNPAGCTLLEVKATHPDPEPIRQMLAAMQVNCAIEKGEQAQLIAIVDTPNGKVELA